MSEIEILKAKLEFLEKAIEEITQADCLDNAQDMAYEAIEMVERMGE